MLRASQRLQRRRAFTILEVMIAATLTAFILTGVLAAFVMIGRTSFRSSSYSQIEAETRRALEVFGRDARLASDIHWTSNQCVTLTPPTRDDTTTTQVTYAYDNVTGSRTAGCFYSVSGSDPSIADRNVLLHNVGSDLNFERFKLPTPGGETTEAATDAQTKELKLTLRPSIALATTAATTQTSFSASYILRNKHVAN